HVSVAGGELAFDTGAAAVRDGDRVTYERGLFTEAYDLTPSSIEQSFTFASVPARGEIVVRIATETELDGRETAGGLELANELGSVRYGRATAVDAAGSSVSLSTALTPNGIEIRVPEEFVASARFPLTIDPVISSFVID